MSLKQLELKFNQMLWVGAMNRICNPAEEIVKSKLLLIKKAMLPQVYESDEISGTLCAAAAEETGFGPEEKIIIGAGDKAASAIGTGTVNSGDCNISLGTSGTVFVCSVSFKSDNKNGTIIDTCIK